MGVAHPVNGKLILLASHFPEPAAHFVGKMKWIAENRKRDIPLFEQGKDFPKVTMKNRVTTGDIEIWQTVQLTAHLLTLPDYLPGFFKRHLYQMRVSFGKNVAMFAPLVATVGDMPLKREIFHKFRVNDSDVRIETPSHKEC